MNRPVSEFAIELAQAAEDYDFDGIVFIVRQGASPDAALGEGTLLTWAVQQGQKGLVRSLIDARANVDLPDVEGNTPMIHAARLGMDDIIEALVEAGANPLIRNGAGKTAHQAVKTAMEQLSAEAADPNADVSSVQSHCSSLGRITQMLDDAAEAQAVIDEIASCCNGIPRDVSLSPVLQLVQPKKPRRSRGPA